jgi:hypothetical protein
VQQVAFPSGAQLTYSDESADSLDVSPHRAGRAAQRSKVQKCLRRFSSDSHVPFLCGREIGDEVGDRCIVVAADKYVRSLMRVYIVVGDRGLAPIAGSVYSRGTSDA